MFMAQTIRTYYFLLNAVFLGAFCFSGVASADGYFPEQESSVSSGSIKHANSGSNNSAQSIFCACNCVHPTKKKIAMGFDFYDSGGRSCGDMNSETCIGSFHGQNYKGKLVRCESGHRPISN